MVYCSPYLKAIANRRNLFPPRPPCSPAPACHLTRAGSSLIDRAFSQWQSLAIWTAFAILTFVGISASFLRATHIADLGARLEPVREAALRAFDVEEPDPSRRSASIASIDTKYASHSSAGLLHVFSGGILLALVPLQFSRRLRSASRKLHRWMGRLIVAAAWTAGAGGVFFGLFHPYAGAPERVVTGLLGGYFLLAISLAFARIRQGRVDEHREWMIRAVAGALGVSTVRIVMLPMDILLTPRGLGPEAIFVHALWSGWTLTLAAAELWIHRTRNRPPSSPEQTR